MKKFKAHFTAYKILKDLIEEKNIIQKRSNKTRLESIWVNMQDLWPGCYAGVISSKENWYGSNIFS
jgi:hypothetical protein